MREIVACSSIYVNHCKLLYIVVSDLTTKNMLMFCAFPLPSVASFHERGVSQSHDNHDIPMGFGSLMTLSQIIKNISHIL